MTREEAIARLKLDRDLCNFNPMTGEEEPMSEDCRKSAKALDMAIKALDQVAKLRELQKNLAEKERFYANQPHEKVKIVETGEIFENAYECAKAINGNAQDIYRCLYGKTKTHKKYHYEVVV